MKLPATVVELVGGAVPASKGPATCFWLQVRPRLWECANQTSAVNLPSPVLSLRVSSHITPTVPSAPTDRDGRNAWPAGAASARGELQRRPPLVERVMKRALLLVESIRFQAL